MASITPMEIPDECVVPQRLTIEHGSWKPSLRLKCLTLSPLRASLPRLYSLLPLRSPLGLFFKRGAESPSIQHIFAFLLSLLLQINELSSERQRCLRRRGRKLRRRRRKLGLSRLPRGILSRLGLNQVQQTPFGLPLDTHFIQSNNSYLLLMEKVSRGTFRK